MGNIISMYQYALPEKMKEDLYALEKQEWPNCHEDEEDMMQFLYIQSHHVIAHVGVLFHDAYQQEKCYQAAGICGVICDQNYRHQGIMIKLFQEVGTFLAKQAIDFSVFTCEEHLIPFYERFGWQHSAITLIGGTKTHPFSSKELSLHTMIRLYKEQEELGFSFHDDIFLELGEGKLW